MMPSNGSDEAGGGAPLHPVLSTPAKPAAQSHSRTKSESLSDEEKALVRASAKFGSLKDPFAETPGVPKSIPPNAFSRRSGAFPQPTPSRSNNVYNRFANAQSASRYRSSTTVDHHVPRFRSNTNGFALNDGNCYPSNPDLVQGHQGFSSIMDAVQYVNNSHGILPNVQAELGQRLQEISRGFSALTIDFRHKIDEANRGREDEHERYKRAMHEVTELRKALSNVESTYQKIVPQLNHAIERENILKDHVNDLNQQLRHSQKQLETLSTDAVRFHTHHDKVLKDYKMQDEKHFKAMTNLENEVKALRSIAGAGASLADLFHTPSNPASVNSVADGNCDSNSPKSQKQVTKALTEKPAFNVGHEMPGNGNTNVGKAHFIPNPKAPAWSPTRQVTGAGHSLHAGDNQHDGSLDGQSADVIVYTGRGLNQNHNKAMTPYQPSPSQGGGAPTFIRTPFGIVFGEYPTVDENSRLGGDRMIPRDKEEWDTIDVQRAMSHLYDLCKGYVANCHLHAPPNVPYDKLKEQESLTWDFLLQIVYKDREHAANHITYLLSITAYVPYVLHGACVYYLFKKLLTPQIFLGFSDKMDGHLRALQDQLANIAETKDRHVHNRSRQRIIEDHAKLIKIIATSKESSEFRSRIVDRHTNILSAILYPCLAQTTAVNAAEKSLRVMVAACFDISIKVWSSGKTLHYIFSECGSKYSPATMEALNGHHMAPSPEELVKSQCRISLVVTPIMTLRDDRDATRMVCQGIHKSQVLVMK